MGTPTDDQIKNSLNNILSNTTIKRACCLGGTDPNNFKVNVRIPIPSDYSVSGVPKINTDIGYIDHVVTVPSSMCKNLPIKDESLANYTKSSKTDSTYNQACDDFYSVYCANMKAFYNDENESVYAGKSPDLEKFAASYKPECACYIQDVPKGVPYSPLCLMYTNCTAANNDAGSVYLDPVSRDTTKMSEFIHTLYTDNRCV